MPTTACFGPFVLDLTSGNLRRGSCEIPMQPAAFDLLTYFVRNAGQLLSRDQLIQHLWPNVFVGDEALSQMIRRVRRALDEDAVTPVWVITVPRRGYRFTDDVMWVESVNNGLQSDLSAAVHETASDLRDGGNGKPGVGDSLVAVQREIGSLRLRPIPPTDPFVGRERFLILLDRYYRDTTQLVTVLGPGGMGKTRLALEFALTQPRLERPIFVDLSDISGLDSLALVMSSALDVPIVDDPPHRNLDRIGLALASGGRRLVILDNFETVRANASTVVDRWTYLAPSVFFLVTSRERLGIAAEVVLPLDPLEPQAACDLFYQRATFAGAQFSGDASESDLVLDLVSRLDNSPLAIELVASRAAIMSVAQLLDHLSSRFLLLCNRKHDAANRHRSLLMVIESSVEKLNSASFQVLIRCAVLPGPFTLETVLAIARYLDISGTMWLPDVLHDLVDCSLLRTRTVGDSAPLFVMQESVREYCLTRGDAISEDQMALLREGLWKRLQLVTLLSRPAPDWPTLLLTAKAQVGSDHVWTARLALLLSPWLHERGPRALGRFFLDKALEGRSDLAPKHQVALLMARAVYELPGDEAAQRWLAEAEQLGRDHHLDELVAEIGFTKVDRLISQGRYRDARDSIDHGSLTAKYSGYLRNYSDFLTIAVAYGLGEFSSGDLSKMALGHNTDSDVTMMLKETTFEESTYSWPIINREQEILARLADFRGHVLGEAGHFSEAVEQYEIALSYYRMLGWRRRQAMTLVNLASPLGFGKREAEANAALKEALAIFEEIGDAHGIAGVLTNRSLTALLARRIDDARRDVERALPVAQAADLFGIQVVLLHNLASVLWLEGNPEAALGLCQQALRLARSNGMLDREKGLHLWCAGLFAALSDVENAEIELHSVDTLLGAAPPTGDTRASRIYEAREVISLHVALARAKQNGNTVAVERLRTTAAVLGSNLGPQAALLLSLLPS